MIQIFHLDQELSRDERLAIRDPLPENWPKLTADEREEVRTKMQFDAVLKAWNEGKYHKVADVNATDIWYAFSHTNSVRHNWFEHPALGVTPMPGKHFSTSKGDIVVNDAGEVGFFNGHSVTYIIYCNEDEAQQSLAA